MLLFIALPIASVVVQSMHIEHPKVMSEVETCGPFSCATEMRVDVEATESLRAEKPLGQFIGLDTYFNRSHLAVGEIKQLWHNYTGLSTFVRASITCRSIRRCRSRWCIPLL